MGKKREKKNKKEREIRWICDNSIVVMYRDLGESFFPPKLKIIKKENVVHRVYFYFIIILFSHPVGAQQNDNKKGI